MQENRPEGGDKLKRPLEHPGRRAPRRPAKTDTVGPLSRVQRERPGRDAPRRPANSEPAVALTHIQRERPGRGAPRQPGQVTSIQEWKNRTARKAAASARRQFYQERIRRMSTEQKQAALLRVIMSDQITQDELDLLLLALVSPALSNR
jgi:hypothetical protein